MWVQQWGSVITFGQVGLQTVFSNKAVPLVGFCDWVGLQAIFHNCSWLGGSQAVLPDVMVLLAGCCVEAWL